MLFDLDILRLSQALAAYSVRRTAVIAENVANADTPGYRARDIPPFATLVSDPPGRPMRATRPGHLGAAPSPDGAFAALPRSRAGQGDVPASGDGAAPNGNDVSLETEMIAAARARQAYDLALGIHAKSLGLLRTALGRR